MSTSVLKKVFIWWQAQSTPQRRYVKKILIFFGAYSVSNISYIMVSHHFNGLNIVYIDRYISFLIFPIFLIFTATRWSDLTRPGLFKKNALITFLSSLAALAIFFIPLKKILGTHTEIAAPVYFGIFYALDLCVFITIFGLRFFNLFIAEISLITGAYAVYLFFDVLLPQYWRYFSFVIVKILSIILPVISPKINFDITQYNVTFNSFSVNIGPVCAGFYSLVSFTLLFALTILLIKKHRSLNYPRALCAWLIGLSVLFFLNIIRVVIIIAVGGWWSPRLALNFFHEYLSAIFLLSLFLGYVYWAVPLIIRRGFTRPKTL